MPSGAVIVRIGSFVRKELAEVFRQPRLVVTLVLGPFLILLAFGAGLDDADPRLRTVFYAQSGSRMASEAERLAEFQQERLEVEGVSNDLGEALERVRNGSIDLVIALPPDPEQTVRSGRQAPIILYHDQFDPIEQLVIALLSQGAAEQVNQQVLAELVRREQSAAEGVQGRVSRALERVRLVRAALERGNEEAAAVELERLERDAAALSRVAPVARALTADALNLDGDSSDASPSVATTAGRLQTLSTLGTEVALSDVRGAETDLEQLLSTLVNFQTLEPAVIVDPFRGVAERVVEGSVELTAFYAPAVVVLLIQHMVVTFVTLSAVRDEQLGTTELFRMSPVSALQLLLGKYLAHALLGGLVAWTLIGLMIVGLGVPMRGSWGLLAAGVVAMLLASAGLGFLTALVARSDTQAVQYAMMVLLASVFLGGFLLTLERFLPPLRAAASLLPATHGNLLLRGVMLRGTASGTQLLASLGAIAGVLFAVAWYLQARRLRSE